MSVNVEDQGFNFSYAVSYNKYFKVWSFVSLGNITPNWLHELPICTCIEGIRVESGTPGFLGYIVPAVSNSTGLNAPKTNVARSGLEIGKESGHLFSQVYDALSGHVSKEISRLQDLPNVSFSKAVDEAYWLLRPLVNENRISTLNDYKFMEALRNIPLILIDIDNERKSVSIKDFQNLDQFWTIEWAFMDSINSLIKNAPISITNRQINTLMEGMGEGVSLPIEARLVTTSYSSIPYSYIYNSHVCHLISVNQNLMRIDISWTKTAPEYDNLWTSMEIRLENPNSRPVKIYVGPDSFFSGVDEYSGIKSYDNLFIKRESKLGQLVHNSIIASKGTDPIEVREADASLFALVKFGTKYSTADRDELRGNLNQSYTQRFNERPTKKTIERMVNIITSSDSIYDFKENKRRDYY